MKATTSVLRMCIATLFTFFAMNLSAQQVNVADITRPDVPVLWLGLDFTEARLIGDMGANEKDIKDRIVHDINDLIVAEAKKYDLNKAFNKDKVSSDLSFTYERNKTMDETKLKSLNADDYERFNEAKVRQIVGQYKFNGKGGLGVMFVVESMNKSKEKASMWVTYVDLATGKVLKTERREGKPGGFGFRNYWARPVYEILNDMKKSK